MEHRTEAACLLETGALYQKRIGLERASGETEPTFAGFKQGAFSLYFGDAPIYHFDLEGRWQRAYIDGIHYLKGLDAEIHAIDRVREGANLVLHRRKLSLDEACDLDARIRSVALDLMSGLDAHGFRRLEPPPGKAQPLGNDELRGMLEQIGRWDDAAWFAHRTRYAGTYGPLPFLPPECQNAVVLQATRGHASGRTFGLSSAAESSIRSTEEFAEHARQVAGLWGRRLLQSRNIFLAGADVLHQPAEQIAAYLDQLGTVFPLRNTDREAETRFEGVHAFLDDFRGPRFGRADWRCFFEKGLNRISLGVESGDPEVRAVYGKGWENAALRATLADLKVAGFGVSVLFLVGAGGVERAAEHHERTVRLIESLDLDRGDFVFLLDENEVRDPGIMPDGLTLLKGANWTEQQRRFREALAPLKGRGIKVLPYTLEKQWT